MATGDFDGDGFLDIVSSETYWGDTGPEQMDYGIAIFLGREIGYPRPGISVPTRTASEIFSTADFNEDGLDDLLVSYGSSNTVSVFVGHESKFLDEGTSFTLHLYQQAPPCHAIGDINGDQHLDLVLGTSYVFSEYIDFVFGNGDGTFQEPISFPVPPSLNADLLVLGDFVEDGHLDMMIDGRSLFYGDGTGSFTWHADLSDRLELADCLAFDCNADGHLDFVQLVEDSPFRLRVHLGNGEGRFTLSQEVEIEDEPRRLAVGDVNNDGFPDLVCTTAIDTPQSSVAILLFLGNGDGSFKEGADLGIGDQTARLILEDIDGDKNTDLLHSSFWKTPRISFGNGDGTFMMALSSIPAGDRPGSAQSADLNRDGVPDVVVTSRALYPDTDVDATLTILLGNSDDSFSTPTTIIVGKQIAYVAIEDFNGDEILDLVASGHRSSTLNCYLGKGDGTFQESLPTDLMVQSEDIQTEDLNGDGIPDLVLCTSETKIEALLGEGDGTFTELLPLLTGGTDSLPGWIEDLNGDNIPDIAVPNVSEWRVYFGKGAGLFGVPTIYSGTFKPFSIAGGDLDGDGDKDLVVAGLRDQIFAPPTTYVYVNDGTGNFTLHATHVDLWSSPLQLLLRDVNGDARLDMIKYLHGPGFFAIYPGRGDATFEAPVVLPLEPGGVGFSTADFDSDGDPDLVFTTDDGLSILYNLTFGQTLPIVGWMAK
ncbi:VCBS repeat-containing protein [bacterium]|nr:VCBS repeat-containing protein [bacterium]